MTGATMPSPLVHLAPYDFASFAARPTTAKTVRMDKCHGRHGDMIVMLIKSAEHAEWDIRESIRTLGLSKLNSSSLRDSSDEVTRGLIETARDYVAVAVLDGFWYKKKIGEKFQSVEYGTNSQPAELWRSVEGQYIGYEYTPPQVVIFMSTPLSFEKLLANMQSLGLSIDNASNDALVVGRDLGGSDYVSHKGTYLDAAKGVDLGSVARAAIPCVGKRAILVTWQEPFARFNDIDRRSSELGIVLHDVDRNLARGLVDRCAEGDLSNDLSMTIPLYSEGVRHDWKL